jgi:hypothetical protein
MTDLPHIEEYNQYFDACDKSNQIALTYDKWIEKNHADKVFHFVGFSESRGSFIISYPLSELLEAYEGDEDTSEFDSSDWIETAKELCGYSNCDCIMTVSDARDAARAILQDTDKFTD